MEDSTEEQLIIRCLHHNWFFTKNLEIALLHLAVDHLDGKMSEPAVEKEAVRFLRPIDITNMRPKPRRNS